MVWQVLTSSNFMRNCAMAGFLVAGSQNAFADNNDQNKRQKTGSATASISITLRVLDAPTPKQREFAMSEITKDCVSVLGNTNGQVHSGYQSYKASRGLGYECTYIDNPADMNGNISKQGRTMRVTITP